MVNDSINETITLFYSPRILVFTTPYAMLNEKVF